MAPRKTAATNQPAEEPVVDKVEMSSEEDEVHSGSEVEAPASPVKKGKKTAASKKPKTSGSDSDAHSDDAPKARKARAPANLDSVMSALEANDVEKAKKLLAKFIEKNGNGEKKRRVLPDGEKRPLSDYQQFMKDEMARLKEADGTMSAKQRMSAAVEAWKARKAAA